VVNYNNEDTWTTGTLGSADTAADSPGVLAYHGKFTVVYRQCAPTSGLRFSQRPYVGSWSDPVSVADNEPCHGRPEIVYLGSGVYGVAYLSDTSPVVRGAYFDKSGSPYSLAEQLRPQISDCTPLATVVRGVLVLGAVDSRQNTGYRAELMDAAGRKVADLRAGANDVRALAPGVYFVRLEPSAVSRQPLAVTKVVLTR
jgi:hypothetical protein